MTIRASTLKLFGFTVAGLLAFLAIDLYRHHAVTIPAPASADSLAGVVARVGGCDSALVHRVTWKQSPDAVLRWVKTDDYAYQGASPWRDLTPLGAQADVHRLTVTFGAGQLTTPLVAHELVHLLCTESGHPPALFARIERYTGR